MFSGNWKKLQCETISIPDTHPNEHKTTIHNDSFIFNSRLVVACAETSCGYVLNDLFNGPTLDESMKSNDGCRVVNKLKQESRVDVNTMWPWGFQRWRLKRFEPQFPRNNRCFVNCSWSFHLDLRTPFTDCGSGLLDYHDHRNSLCWSNEFILRN